MGARELGLWVDEPKSQGKTPMRGNPSPDMTYLSTYPWFLMHLVLSKKN